MGFTPNGFAYRGQRKTWKEIWRSVIQPERRSAVDAGCRNRAKSRILPAFDPQRTAETTTALHAASL
ncbi:hypothetical protein B5X24_HaOG206239 [Helicoverpa armigera]|nr:hypothetical protein B5X24_HaOG206239 [Helicoverpa armigera]